MVVHSAICSSIYMSFACVLNQNNTPTYILTLVLLVIYLRGMNLEELVEPIPGLPWRTGL